MPPFFLSAHIKLTELLIFSTALEIACRKYIFNTSSEDLTLRFNCAPAYKTGTIGMNVTTVQWRRFNNTNDLKMFLNGGTDSSVLLTDTTDMNVTFSNASGVTNASLEIQSRTNESAVGFYLPTFEVPGPPKQEIHAQSFVIYRKFCL